MRKLVSAAVLACFGLAAAAVSVPAEARVYVGVNVGLPGVAVVAPAPVIGYAPAYAAPYYYVGPRYYYPGYVRYGYRGPYGGHRFGYGWGHAHGRPWR